MPLHRWIITVASYVVPKSLRPDWRAEWDAEIHQRESARANWTRVRGHRLALLRESAGAIWDALWLQSRQWYSLRLFGRHWRLALAAVASLAVAIAAATVGLSAANALLLRAPGVGNPETLRLIHIRTAADPFGGASLPEYLDYQRGTRAFADVAAFPYSISSLSMKVGDRTEQVTATETSDNYFSVLGISPRLGMLTFRSSPSRDILDIVVSERLWRSLGADPKLAGTTIRLNDQPVTIVGVVPATFGGMTWGFDPDLWMSQPAAQRVFDSAPSRVTDRAQRSLHLIGRLRPGVSDAQALTDLQGIAAGLAHDFPATNADHTAGLTRLTITPPGDRGWVAMILAALLLIVLLTLIVACTNVTNLLLGLSSHRRHEMLVRAALGASRLQLVLPVVRESAVLGIGSGLLGAAAAWLILERLAMLKLSLGGSFPTLSLDVRPDATVLLATLGVAGLAGIAVGIAPALRGAADGLSGALHRELSAAEPRKTRIRNILVVIQIAVATIVLATVGMAVHSLVSLRRPSLGFTARHLVYAGVDVARTGYDARTGPAFYERMRQRLRATPQIEAVTLASDGPMMGYSVDHVTAEGTPPPEDRGAETPYLVVDDDYFSTVGIGVMQGRTFDSRDRTGGADVAVINVTLARRFFEGRDAIGQRLRLDDRHRVVSIVGVVPDGKYSEIDEAALSMIYLPLAQHYVPVITAIARTTAPRDSVALALQDLQPNLVAGGVGVMTLDEVLGLSTLLPLAIVWTTVAFGVLALALAVFGLYSTVFHAVSQRRVELGIRTALGATPAHLFRMVLGQTSWLAGIGAILGLAAGLVLTPLAASIFYGIGPVESWVLSGAAVVVTTIVVVTTYSVVRPWARLAALDLLRR